MKSLDVHLASYDVLEAALDAGSLQAGPGHGNQLGRFSEASLRQSTDMGPDKG